jgi:hypothetical protein
MPDLQTALQSALIKTTLNAWDAHEDQIRKPQQEKPMANPNPVVTVAEGTHGFIASNNVMRETFNAVKHAPKMQLKEYVEMLARNGFKPNSTSAVLYQLIRAGQIARDGNGALSVTCNEYAPIKQVKKPRVVVLDKAPEPKPRQIVIVKRKRNEEAQGIAALKGDSAAPAVEKFDRVQRDVPMLNEVLRQAPKAFHPSSIVDNLSVLHARELYDYLKKIFTGDMK